MDAISNADRFVALLRQKLAERSQARGAQKRGRTQSERAADQGGEAVRSVAARAARAGADDRKLRRTIVEQLLAERFGSALVNDPRFQEMVGEVSELMGADPAIGAMLEEVMVAVRS